MAYTMSYDVTHLMTGCWWVRLCYNSDDCLMLSHMISCV